MRHGVDQIQPLQGPRQTSVPVEIMDVVQIDFPSKSSQRNRPRSWVLSSPVEHQHLLHVVQRQHRPRGSEDPRQLHAGGYEFSRPACRAKEQGSGAFCGARPWERKEPVPVPPASVPRGVRQLQVQLADAKRPDAAGREKGGSQWIMLTLEHHMGCFLGPIRTWTSPPLLRLSLLLVSSGSLYLSLRSLLLAP